VIAAGRGDHAGAWDFSRQQVGKGASRLERAGVLEKLQFEAQPDTGEPEIRAIDLDRRSASDTRPYQALDLGDGIAIDAGFLSHGGAPEGYPVDLSSGFG
jgi:hypothetical protein